AIDDEIGSIMENNTWVLSDLQPGCKPLGCKWIFKRKMKVDGTFDKFKARLVIQGFRQKEGIDYFDTYAPVARITTIRLLLALAAIHNLVIHQMDVKTTFLNGDLDEKVYMKQPEGFIMSDKLDLDHNGTPVDATKYRSMIGALMYLTSSIPDIVHATCLCARYQAKPTEKHLKEVKRIFRYLRGTINTGLAGGIYPGTLPLDRVEVLGSVNGVTTSLQLSQNSSPPMLDHQDKYMMKAQVHVSKSSAISDIQPLPRRKHYCQSYQVVKHMLRGRLLESFQDREHEGGDTRS
nr:zinc finger, CCHC-type [Tanacetum cinerariifolium]